MCTCTSCEYTDGYADKGFAAWPRGNPAGRKSAERYAAHVKHAQSWGKDRVPELPAGIWNRSPFPCSGTNWTDPGKDRTYPPADKTLGTAEYVSAFLSSNNYVTEETIEKQAHYRRIVEREEAINAKRWANVEKARAAEAAPPRPDQPGKANPHLPAVNRHDGPGARIYAMPKAKPKQQAKQEPKRSRGRPAMDGRRVIIKLAEHQIKAAEKLGDGNIAAGIRLAIANAK